MRTLDIDKLKTLNPFELEKRLTYRAKDLIIMAAYEVLKSWVADGGYRVPLVIPAYGDFVLDASAALDRGEFCGYVSWPTEDGKSVDAQWALKADRTGIIVGRADCDKRVKLHATRLFKK